MSLAESHLDPLPTVGKNAGRSANNENESTIKYENFHSILDDPQLAECFLALPDEDCYLNLPNTSAVDSPLDLQTISESQQDDTELQARVEKHTSLYFTKKIGDFSIVCYLKDFEKRNEKWRIALPKKMVKSAIKWSHIVTGHPGSKKLRLTLEQRYYHPEMRRYIDAY